MDSVKIGFIGLGGRGSGLADLVVKMDDVTIPAVSDVYQDRVDKKIERIEELKGYRPYGYNDYRQMLDRGDLNGVVIASSWTGTEIPWMSAPMGKSILKEVSLLYVIPKESVSLG